jgi:hypothetical protein
MSKFNKTVFHFLTKKCWFHHLGRCHVSNNPTATQGDTSVPRHNGHMESEASRVRTGDLVVRGLSSCQGTNHSLLIYMGLRIYLTSFSGFFQLFLKISRLQRRFRPSKKKFWKNFELEKVDKSNFSTFSS